MDYHNTLGWILQFSKGIFVQHLECMIHHFESSPEGSFAIIPHPVARMAEIMQ